MDPYAISLADVFRILEALDQAGGERLIQGLKNRAAALNIPNGRVTLGMIQRLLEQTGGSTTLPDEIMALLQQSRHADIMPAGIQPIGTRASAQLVSTVYSTWANALTTMPMHKRISIEDVERCLHVQFSSEQRAVLAQIPFAKETLASCSRTHMLFPGFPIAIEQMVRVVPADIFSNDARITAIQSIWGQQQPALRWYLLRCGVTPKSTSQSYYNQLTRLPKQEEVPQLAEVVFGIVLKAIVHKDHLFQRQHVRCASFPPNNSDQPIVGFFTKQGFEMIGFGPTRGNDTLGIASMRKLHT